MTQYCTGPKGLKIKITTIGYELPEIRERHFTEDPETGRVSSHDVIRRPNLQLTTQVVACKNRFGHIRLYGKQGNFNGRQ